jgi:outer membrane protein assembly factor BamB
MNHDGSDFQYVVALDQQTGKTVWKTNRSVDFQDLDANGKPQADGDFRKAFATPHVAKAGGKDILISSGAKAHYAYDPATGKELWRVEERGQHSASTRPVLAHGMVYLPTGFAKGQLLAVKLGGSGILDASQVAWRTTRSVPNKPSVTLDGDLLFTVDDSGIASCLEARTGNEVWRERAGGNFSASPLLAEGRLYLCNEEGKTVVVAASREFKKLAENTLADGFMASPAVAGKALILRTKTALYRIEK